MTDEMLVFVLLLVATAGGCGLGMWAHESNDDRACEEHCAPYAIDKTADICQCQQVSPAVVAEDCGQ